MLRQAGQCWDHADLRPMRELLGLYELAGDSDPREFTWRYLRRLTHSDRLTLEGHTSDVYLAAYSPDGKFVEIMELEGHPWFVGCQFHPEYRSRPMTPHPLFRSFIAAARTNKNSQKSAPAPATIPHEAELV